MKLSAASGICKPTLRFIIDALPRADGGAFAFSQERNIMATEKCERCDFSESELVCGLCKYPAEFTDAGAQAWGLSSLEVSFEVEDVEYPRTYEFRASLLDDGIMFETERLSCDSEEEADELLDAAWEGLSAMMGFDVDEVALDKGIGAADSLISPYGTVCYAIIPYDMALLVRGAFVRRRLA